jgi:hypothetical protein
MEYKAFVLRAKGLYGIGRTGRELVTARLGGKWIFKREADFPRKNG